MTNYEKIKQMTVEEMAKVIYEMSLNYCCACAEFDCTHDGCINTLVTLLEQEAEK